MKLEFFSNMYRSQIRGEKSKKSVDDSPSASASQSSKQDVDKVSQASKSIVRKKISTVKAKQMNPKHYPELPLPPIISSSLQSTSRGSSISSKSDPGPDKVSSDKFIPSRIKDGLKMCILMPFLVNNEGKDEEKPVMLIVKDENLHELKISLPYKMKFTKGKNEDYVWRHTDKYLLQGQIIAIDGEFPENYFSI